MTDTDWPRVRETLAVKCMGWYKRANVYVKQVTTDCVGRDAGRTHDIVVMRLTHDWKPDERWYDLGVLVDAMRADWLLELTLVEDHVGAHYLHAYSEGRSALATTALDRFTGIAQIVALAAYRALGGDDD